MKTGEKVLGLAALGIASAVIVGTALTMKASGGVPPPPPPPPPPSNPALSSPIYYRFVNARMWQGSSSSAPQPTFPLGETASTLGMAIAQMNPSMVSGMVRIDKGFETFPSQMITDISVLQTIVHSTNPNCKFDVAIRGNEFTTGADITNTMNLIAAQNVEFDAFWVSVYDKMNLDTQTGAVNGAHALGKACGGAINDTANPGTIFVKPDYLTVPDYAYLVPQNIAQFTALNIPVLLQVNNGAVPVDALQQTEHNDWGSVLQTSAFVTISFAGGTITVTTSRADYIQRMSAAQSTYGIGFAYPECWPEDPIATYVANYKDPVLQPLMISLATQNNPHP